MKRSGSRTTLKTLGLDLGYCASALLFGVFSGLSFWAIRIEPESANELRMFGLFFGLVFALAVGWPLLRSSERSVIQLTYCDIRGQREPAVRIRFSMVKVWIVLIGATAFGAFCWWGVSRAEDLENRVKAAVGLVFYAAVAFVVGFNLVRRSSGIFLTSKGIDWREPFSVFGSIQIPWSSIVVAKVYQHQEQYSKPMSVGLVLRDLELLKLSRSVERKLRRNRSKCPYHLYSHAESLLYPLEKLAEALQFYADNENARTELAEGSAALRLSAALENEDARIAKSAI